MDGTVGGAVGANRGTVGCTTGGTIGDKTFHILSEEGEGRGMMDMILGRAPPSHEPSHHNLRGCSTKPSRWPTVGHQGHEPAAGEALRWCVVHVYPGSGARSTPSEPPPPPPRARTSPASQPTTAVAVGTAADHQWRVSWARARWGSHSARSTPSAPPPPSPQRAVTRGHRPLSIRLTAACSTSDLDWNFVAAWSGLSWCGQECGAQSDWHQGAWP